MQIRDHFIMAMLVFFLHKHSTSATDVGDIFHLLVTNIIIIILFYFFIYSFYLFYNYKLGHNQWPQGKQSM